MITAILYNTKELVNLEDPKRKMIGEGYGKVENEYFLFLQCIQY